VIRYAALAGMELGAGRLECNGIIAEKSQVGAFQLTALSSVPLSRVSYPYAEVAERLNAPVLGTRSLR
jgi:hypothetical protein